jgi:thymidine kinase
MAAKHGKAGVPPKSGHIELILGPMFAGKSTEMLRRIRRYTAAKQRCLVVKFRADVRYDKDAMSTHDLQTMKARCLDRLDDLAPEVLDAWDVIGIDEGQFFPDIATFAERAANAGKIVIVAALDGTFERRPFGAILTLVPLAEQVVKLTSVCMRCHGSAAFTRRIDGNDHRLRIIGGADVYTACCRSCWHRAEDEACKRQ